MSFQKLVSFIIVCEFIALGVFFGAMMGATVANGGRLVLDMNRFSEQWIEYWIILVLMAVVPYALYVVDDAYTST